LSISTNLTLHNFEKNSMSSTLLSQACIKKKFFFKCLHFLQDITLTYLLFFFFVLYLKKMQKSSKTSICRLFYRFFFFFYNFRVVFNFSLEKYWKNWKTCQLKYQIDQIDTICYRSVIHVKKIRPLLHEKVLTVKNKQKINNIRVIRSW